MNIDFIDGRLVLDRARDKIDCDFLRAQGGRCRHLGFWEFMPWKVKAIVEAHPKAWHGPALTDYLTKPAVDRDKAVVTSGVDGFLAAWELHSALPLIVVLSEVAAALAPSVVSRAREAQIAFGDRTGALNSWDATVEGQVLHTLMEKADRLLIVEAPPTEWSVMAWFQIACWVGICRRSDELAWCEEFTVLGEYRVGVNQIPRYQAVPKPNWRDAVDFLKPYTLNGGKT